jgi:hypothetical protein
MAQHIFVGTTPPAFTPPDVGHHYVDTTAKKHYVSVGTSASSDWSATDYNISALPNITDRPSSGDLLPIYDTSTATNTKISLQDFISKRGNITNQGYLWATDFVINETNVLLAVGSGGGNSTQQGSYGMDNIERALGISESDTGNTATGRRTVSSNLSSLTTGLARMRFGARHALNQLSNPFDIFVTTLGFINLNTSGVDHNAGAYFSYTSTANGGRWEAVTAAGGGSPTRTRVDTGVAADTLYNIFEIEILEDTSAALFYINGALVATISTNLPPTSTAANFTFGFGWKIEKFFGTTVVAHSTDWAYIETSRTTPR